MFFRVDLDARLVCFEDKGVFEVRVLDVVDDDSLFYSLKICFFAELK